ncbi:DUF488 family protein [Parablastomonas sp. CN1-191]|uniref:DUF488 domain-containing protein n=1 Tax=Parablastomonas sp. CN1-191 TaxID=3400908 RepID=UPI003BF7E2B2
MTTLFTIGYEGASLPDFIATLAEAGVEHVLDVRELPQSRRPGFSKKALAQALGEADIGYSHCKQLGDPKHGREAARRGNMAEFRMIFEAHLDLEASRKALEDAAIVATRAPTALLCYERDPKDCHRSLVAKRLLGLRSLRVRHLGVRSRGHTRAGAAAAAAVGHA